MADTKLPEEDVVPEDLWTLIKQLRIRDIIDQLSIRDLINAIKEIVSGDFQHLTNVARGRALSLKTFTLLYREFVKTRTGCVILTVVTVVVCNILLIFFMILTLSLLHGLNFISTEPAAESVTATSQSTFGVSAVFDTLQSAAVAGYDNPFFVVALFLGGAVIGAMFGTRNMPKRKSA